MRVLYAIQGTGNGHLSRAQELIPALKKYAHVDVLISGNQSELTTDLEFRYIMNGLTFVQGTKGNISWSGTLKNFRVRDFYRAIRSLPVEMYDLIITDFEPVSAWAGRLKGVPTVELSHQAAVIHPGSPKPDKLALLGKFVLNNYCPSSSKFGLHFDKYAPSIFTPIIRRSVRNLTPVDGSFNVVYLPAYGDSQIHHFLKQFDSEWHVFSKHSKSVRRLGNVVFHPIEQKVFISYLEQCGGVLC
ncbi:MAG: glycosyltransferase family protein, partial [Bacteroidota bacterium]